MDWEKDRYTTSSGDHEHENKILLTLGEARLHPGQIITCGDIVPNLT